MSCPQCRQENPPGAKFCSGCGGRLESVCPACGHPTLPGGRFCNECGKPVAAASAALPAPVSPQSYTPRYLAEKILTSRHALEGERKQVTVLFADIKGSLELLSDRDPEEARKLLDPVLERMMEAVHRYEGTVNQVMGDGIMALFGAPLAHEDHAVRACYAALAMQQAIHRYTAEVRRDHGIEVQIRVGLNSGEVVVRTIGSDLRMDYSAVGQTTHLAARMEQLATPGSIAADRRDAAARRGVRPGRSRSARSRSRGCAAPGRCLRAGGAIGDAHAPSGGGRARAHPLRGARPGARPSPPGSRQGGRGSRADRGRGGRARGGEVALALGVHPFTPDPGLARPRVELLLLRQGQRLSARHRSAARATSGSRRVTMRAAYGRRSRASS